MPMRCLEAAYTGRKAVADSRCLTSIPFARPYPHPAAPNFYVHPDLVAAYPPGHPIWPRTSIPVEEANTDECRW